MIYLVEEEATQLNAASLSDGRISRNLNKNIQRDSEPEGRHNIFIGDWEKLL